jgi:hypothetical protein
MSPITPQYFTVSLAVKYGSVLFPFDIGKFVLALSREGFLLPESLEDTILALPLRRRLGLSGIVARKPDLAVRVDQEAQVVAIHAVDARAALREMEAVEVLLKEQFAVVSQSLAQYYEFMASMTVRAGVDPSEAWTALLSQTSVVEEASKVLRKDLSPFGLRLVPKGSVPNQTDWFDIRIEPEMHAPDSYHYIDVIYRNSDRADVFAFVRNLEKAVKALVSIVEGA